MLTVGALDVFEREYTQKFRRFASEFGEFVTYERDRGARDIGLHLTHRLRSGKERMSSALCWFQLKGIKAATVSEDEFRRRSTIRVALKIRHLQFWFLQPMPTYLAVFVESAGIFLVLNLQQYVDKRWGRAVMSVRTRQVTVEVPCSSVLDNQAFYLILKDSDVGEWSKALGDEMETVRICRRDYDLIWHFGTALKRRVTHRVTLIDWQSKLRGEIHFEESPLAGDEEWCEIREHWQSNLRACDAEEAYPYLEFHAFDDEEDWSGLDEDDRHVPKLRLANRDEIMGTDCAGEYFEYVLGARLNRLGKRLFRSVAALEKIGLIEIDDRLNEFISIAPWESRSV